MTQEFTAAATTFPSSLIYSIDVPGVKNFKASFSYNFFDADESVNDSGVPSKESLDLMNITNAFLNKLSYGASSVPSSQLEKIPRYVKLTFEKPSALGVEAGYIGGFGGDNTQQKFLSNIVFEDDFAQGNYSTVNTDNRNITQITNSYFTGSTTQNVDRIQRNFDDSDKNVLDTLTAISSINFQQNDVSFSKKTVNGYFDKVQKVSFNGQVSNSVIFDFFVSTTESIDPNKIFYKNHLEIAKSRQTQFNAKNFLVSDNSYKTSINVYQDIAETVNESYEKDDFRVTHIGYVVEKIELFSDERTSKVHDNIIIYSSNTSSYVDLKVRYGALYVYKIRALYKIRYPAIVNDATMQSKFVESIVASTPEIAYVETTENVAPPPPVELRFVWDYDRFNPLTADFDPIANKPYPNTGVRGSLMISWALPVNSQMDIKKFQLFRRKSIDDPFELIKMFDFDNSVIKFPHPETTIDSYLIQQSIIERKNKPAISVPIMKYYDDEFLKTSEYVYCVASTDAHGLVSNYSEQFKVRFDAVSNKLMLNFVSIAGAPRQYPNMYLQQDLFLDTIKSANKKNLHVYLTPECYSVTKDSETIIDILNASASSKYVINFINTDKGIGKNVNINVDVNWEDIQNMPT